VDPVGEHVDVVDVPERPVGELVAFLLPLGGEPGDDRGRQTRTRAEELLERGHEVPELIPWRYIKGRTSATFGDFLAHGGRITERNRSFSRSPRRPDGR